MIPRNPYQIQGGHAANAFRKVGSFAAKLADIKGQMDAAPLAKQEAADRKTAKEAESKSKAAARQSEADSRRAAGRKAELKHLKAKEDLRTKSAVNRVSAVAAARAAAKKANTPAKTTAKPVKPAANPTAPKPTSTKKPNPNASAAQAAGSKPVQRKIK